jgi:ribose transport system substrate-binding protein
MNASSRNGKAVQPLIILEELRRGGAAARLQGQLDGMQAALGAIPPAKILRLDSGNTVQVSAAHMAAALAGLPYAHRLPVLCFNDDAALGALQAARRLGRESDLLLVGQGADRSIRTEIRRTGSRVVGSSAYWPEKYGPRLIEVALQILRGGHLRVYPAVSDHPQNVDLYYRDPACPGFDLPPSWRV